MRPVPGMIRLVVLAMVAALMGGCEPRAPQFVSGSPDVPEVSAVTLQRMSRALGLSESQRSDATDLHTGYAEAHQSAARKYKDYLALADRIIEKADEDKPLKIKRAEATVKFARYAQDLASRFIDDLRLILTPEQLAKWESAEKALRRARSIGSAYAERTADLREAVESGETLGKPRSAELDEALRAWEDSIDPVLVRKESFIRTVPADELRAEREGDGAWKQASYRRWRLIIRDERNVTTRALRQVVALLPADAAAMLARSVHERVYPWLFGQSEAGEVLRRASELPDLSAEATERIAELRRELLREQSALASAAAVEFERWELSATDDQIAASGNPELRPDLAAKGAALETRIGTRLNEILTAEQQRAIQSGTVTRELPPLEFDEPQ
ncbi:MAG: hypothetical protein ACKVZJ_07160 [Phycisphaerales bacterium]